MNWSIYGFLGERDNSVCYTELLGSNRASMGAGCHVTYCLLLPGPVPTAVEAPVRTVGATEGPGGFGGINKIVRELGPVAMVIPARSTPKLRINNV